MKMVRLMCGMRLKDRVSDVELRRRLGSKGINEEIGISRLGWFGHVERMDDQNWVKRSKSFNVEGVAPRGRPKKTWDQTLRADLESKNLTSEAALDRDAWKAAIRT